MKKGEHFHIVDSYFNSESIIDPSHEYYYKKIL